MKNFLVSTCFCMFLISCSGGNEKTSDIDTMNGTPNHVYEDTTVSPRPDGYAPPNTTVDTGEATKDSANK